jgi:hypothetical protein
LAHKDPSPWEILNDYSKTVVAVAAGFLAFTVTFSDKLIGAGNPVPPSLLLCWLLLVASIGLALFAVGRLTGYLRNPDKNVRSFLLPSNGSYFLLGFAAFAFFYFAVTALKSNEPNAESISAEQSAHRYLSQMDSAFCVSSSVKAISWNDVTARWEFLYRTRTDSAFIAVDPKTMKVTRFRK